jgi:hypothetical protein
MAALAANSFAASTTANTFAVPAPAIMRWRRLASSAEAAHIH